MSSRKRLRASGRIVAFVFAALTAVVVAPTSAVAGGAAGYTTFDATTGGCLDNPTGVNCNNYAAKEDVYMNGGPTGGNGLADGSYYFAVLVPGFQNGGFVDGADGNLSDTTAGATTGDLGTGDLIANRTFTISSGLISSYSGTHGTGTDLQGDFIIQLMPYDNTSNNGGVYILAICQVGATSPSQCKYDAFKVEPPGGGAQVAGVMSGKKYRDDNKNGQFDPGELGLQGWTITIVGTDGTNTTVTTDSAGNWLYTTPSHLATAGTTTFTISEVLQSGWKETGNTVNQSIPSGGANASLASFVYTVTLPNNAVATADGLNFGNIPQGVVSGEKYYDSDLSGTLNNSEAGISGWEISQGGAAVTTITTDPSGNFSVTLDPGTYTFTEILATNAWTQTGNVTDQSAVTGGATVVLASKAYTVVVPGDQPSTVTGLNFGNVCSVTPGGLTMGFWSNKNGGSLITAADLTALDALNLRNANGTNFDPTTVKQFQTWILNATATNMAYMLSAQMAATFLNVQHGFTNGSALVDGFTSVNGEIAYANSLLANPIVGGTFNGLNGGLTIQASALRTEQERVKNIFDKINNGGSFIQPSQQTCPAPTFPS
jgi:hypothetical protein